MYVPNQQQQQMNLNGNNQIVRSNKTKLIKTIMENIKQFSRLDEQKEIIKPIIDNLKIFSVEEFSKFFQVLANTQHLLNTDASSLNKNKDFISIDDKVLDFNEKEIFSKKNENEFSPHEEKNVNKFIKRKDLSISTLIKEKLGSNLNNNSPNQTNSPNNNASKIIDNSIIYEIFIKNLKKGINFNSCDGFRKKITRMQKLFNANDANFSKNNENKNNGTSENITNLDDFSTSNFNGHNKILELNEKSQLSELSNNEENCSTDNSSSKKYDFLSEMKKFIKLHVRYIYVNNITKIEKEDKIILDFIFENINEDFYEIVKFWLFKEFLSVNESDSPAVVRRYDTILNEFMLRIEKQEVFRQEFLTTENLYSFLTEIPLFNEKVIDFVVKHYSQISLPSEANLINSTINEFNYVIELEREAEKNDEIYMNVIYIIYKKMKKKITQLNQLLASNLAAPNPNANVSFNAEALRSNYFESLKKLRNIILNLSNIDNEKILKAKIKFISGKIIPLGDFEEIYDFSKRQFKSLMKYAETPVNRNLVLSKYGLFFYLCLSYPDHFINDFIVECPKVYNECTKPVCDILDKIIERSNINSALSTENLRTLVQNCAEKCLNIVLLVIKIIKTEIGSEKLYKEILNYYKRNGEPIEVLIMLSVKMNIFFAYVYEKIKINEKFNEEILDKVFNEINNNSKEDLIISYLKKEEKINQNFEAINTDLLENIKDKIIFYIVFFIEEYIIKRNIHINKLNFFMKFFEKLSNQGGSEKFNENLNYLLELIKLKNFSEINFFQLTNYFIEYFKDNSARNIIMST
jgi:hypothetical protein